MSEYAKRQRETNIAASNVQLDVQLWCNACRRVPIHMPLSSVLNMCDSQGGRAGGRSYGMTTEARPLKIKFSQKVTEREAERVGRRSLSTASLMNSGYARSRSSST